MVGEMAQLMVEQMVDQTVAQTVAQTAAWMVLHLAMRKVDHLTDQMACKKADLTVGERECQMVWLKVDTTVGWMAGLLADSMALH